MRTWEITKKFVFNNKDKTEILIIEKKKKRKRRSPAKMKSSKVSKR